MGILKIHGSFKFLIFVFMFLKSVFFVFILDAIFCATIFFSFLRTVCGLLRNLDVFVVVPFLNSTGLEIGAEADLRCSFH